MGFSEEVSTIDSSSYVAPLSSCFYDHDDTINIPDAPARLKKELDAVLTLQADVDTTVRAIQNAKTAIEKEHGSDDTLDMLSSLERTHDRLMTKVDALYVSLTVRDMFPKLKGVSLDFVRILLLARDLKINIRKRAIGSFFEWDKLDRAVGGAQQALGDGQILVA
ncbi:hypothetical protein JVT61DRAFT_1322 [Boletus reticuloceps]|uniref:Uncharacterized protein n=1 Tax=Boletus reticuloceps TaxID=495285 RepID=A0A8I2YRP9_9AGAM|nr:hypothetical protein JVT61DRAFT_1322 [Boletus reticuloceps]